MSGSRADQAWAKVKWAMMVRRGWLTFPTAALAGVMGTASGKIDLPIPFLSSLLGPSTMPAAVIPSLLVAVIASGMIQSAEMPWTSASVRNVIGHSVATAVGIVLVVFAASSLTGVFVDDNNSAWLMVRNVTGFLALWSAAKALGAYRFAGLAPVIYLLVAATFARNPMGDVRGWAWILGRNPGDPWGIVTVVLGGLLTLVYLLRRRTLIGKARGLGTLP